MVCTAAFEGVMSASCKKPLYLPNEANTSTQPARKRLKSHFFIEGKKLHDCNYLATKVIWKLVNVDGGMRIFFGGGGESGLRRT